MQLIQFSNPFLAAVVASSTATDAGFKDLNYCMADARTLKNLVAAQGFVNGCYVEYNGADLVSLTQHNEDIMKRCSDERSSCCCLQLCSYEVTCPTCIAGCETSCVTAYGGDCTSAGPGDCGDCTD